MKSSCSFLAATAVALAAFASTGSAQTLTLTNPSFELPAVAAGAFSVADVPGWGKVGTTDIGVHRNGEFGAPTTGSDQLQLLFIGNGQNFGSTFQDVVGNTTVGGAQIASYTFTIALATRGGTFTGNVNVGLQDLTGGTGNVATVTNVVPGSTLSNTTYRDFSVTLPATTVAPGDSLRIFIDKGAGNSLIVLDNARLVANAVPEPSTWAMMLGGLGVLAGAVLRRVRTA